VELTVPYYWNIAPNRDATFFPAIMTKRGIDLGGEFRYLERDYNGKLRANYMPGDRLRDSDRWGYAITHDGMLSHNGVTSPLGLNLNLNRVSDDNYWRDFSRGGSSLTQRLLANDASCTGGRAISAHGAVADLADAAGRGLAHRAALRPGAADGRPLSRANLAGGLDASVETDYTEFKSVRALTLQPNAKRSLRTGPDQPPLAGTGLVHHAQAAAAHHRLPV
jgi:LPS-assembly protein